MKSVIYIAALWSPQTRKDRIYTLTDREGIDETCLHAIEV